MWLCCPAVCVFSRHHRRAAAMADITAPAPYVVAVSHHKSTKVVMGCTTRRLHKRLSTRLGRAEAGSKQLRGVDVW